MATSLSIRHAATDDKERWKALWGDYNAFYGRKVNTALSNDIISSTWQRFFDETEPVHFLVAELGRRLVGLAHYIFHRNIITVEPTCYLQDLFTSATARGNGVGLALMSEFCHQAKIAGVKNVYWHTHSMNETAKRLYNKIAVDTEFTVYRKSI